ncbi:MAG TPA: hypothetical protein VLZ83_14915 [Edaphocola sp.]|nr:hypothetical protein [Edaphocola sp.]
MKKKLLVYNLISILSFTLFSCFLVAKNKHHKDDHSVFTPSPQIGSVDLTSLHSQSVNFRKSARLCSNSTVRSDEVVNFMDLSEAALKELATLAEQIKNESSPNSIVGYRLIFGKSSVDAFTTNIILVGLKNSDDGKVEDIPSAKILNNQIDCPARCDIYRSTIVTGNNMGERFNLCN